MDLKHVAADMPSDRHLARAPIALCYDNGASAAPSCSHKGCRNNPKESAPYSIDCTPQMNAMPPNGAKRVLLHSCCAPCSGAMFEEMLEKGLDVTIFFYNPNIHPRKEYEIRKEENKRYAKQHGVDFVDADYDAKSWFKRMKGLEYDPERGVRCTACFDMRMEVTAAYAKAHCFTTTNATSRWKDVRQVNDSGLRAAARYPNIQYWIYNWQTDEIFYKQEYCIGLTYVPNKLQFFEIFFYNTCGCSYSLRDSNLWRKSQGIPPVKIGGETAGLGTRYFEDPQKDAAEESQEVVDHFFRDAKRQFDDDRLKKLYSRRKKHVVDTDLNNW